MATASITYALSNGTTADATHVSTNFTDIVNFLNTHCVHKDGSIAMTGALTLQAQDPSNANHAVRKQYVDRKAILTRQVAVVNPPVTINSGDVVASVTVSDPGYNMYVWGHATISPYTQNQTAAFSIWVLEILVNGSVKDRLRVPFSIALPAAISIGVPLRSTAVNTGGNTTVQMRLTRDTGDGNLRVDADSTHNCLQVYSCAQ